MSNMPNGGHLPPVPPPPVSQPGRGMAVASLVLGIVSLVSTFVVPIVFISWILAIVGIGLAVAAKQQGYTGGMATAGLVCSIVSLALSIFVFFVFITCAACLFALPLMNF